MPQNSILKPENVKRSPRPNPHFDTIINTNTEQVRKLHMDLSLHTLESKIQI